MAACSQVSVYRGMFFDFVNRVERKCRRRKNLRKSEMVRFLEALATWEKCLTDIGQMDHEVQQTIQRMRQCCERILHGLGTLAGAGDGSPPAPNGDVEPMDCSE